MLHAGWDAGDLFQGSDKSPLENPGWDNTGKSVWFRVSAWRRLAETCNQYLTKGQRVLVVGEMEESSTWTDQEGNTRSSLEGRARNVQFLSTRAEAQGLTPGQDQSEDVGMPF